MHYTFGTQVKSAHNKPDRDSSEPEIYSIFLNRITIVILEGFEPWLLEWLD
jgi:hypothetical protein